MSAPTAIRNQRDAHLLLVQWADGRSHSFSHARLRAACPCSSCRAGRLAGRIDLASSDVQITAINSQGYGVQLVFSDGHERGIYPWSYLQGLTA
ncbi:DUF971 domain-containing protein [Pseudomonas sp. 5P_3.1_Bac2]|uniref:DUF971 domain-containing protein n=1 Tax=Pseudomonas sp. 5P_3.1_Bac2 TaxID=2971617 RepID=UPI0021C70886|nr:DUF971 domain-containing protein [Pseudomonas sp. 5P_3.1_Bac2]MCU1716648.1 DUF971 domain-containing protein [Pseudomonas sp. 5P_3.1_Bac2]